MGDLTVAHRAAKKNYTRFELIYLNAGGRNDFNFINTQGFLVERGYYVFRTSVTKHLYIRMIDNIVREVGLKDIKDEILNSIKKDLTRSEYEFALKNINKVANNDFLETLPALKIEFKRDTKETMQLYFRNCTVNITKNLLLVIEYSELPKETFIWESQIIQRDFEKDVVMTCDFKQFCWNISNAKDERFLPICSMIGYLIHNYKNPAYCPAIILNDEVISDNPEGGTGKGILIKAIEYFVKSLTIEGKTFNFDKGFLYQRVTQDTKLICFQDVVKTFNFERLFSVLTEGIVTERKGKDEVFFSFEDSPKVVISTNYAIRGSGNSHERRRFELEISQYYNAENTPLDEFNKMFFFDWSELEWKQFDRFMVDCCQFYLLNGLVTQQLINLPEKKLAAETSVDFLEFMQDFDFDVVAKVELYKKFLNEYEEYSKHKWFSKQVFSKWVVSYANSKQYSVEDYIYLSIRHYKFLKQNII